jgi:hypothetical protein
MSASLTELLNQIPPDRRAVVLAQAERMIREESKRRRSAPEQNQDDPGYGAIAVLALIVLMFAAAIFSLVVRVKAEPAQPVPLCSITHTEVVEALVPVGTTNLGFQVVAPDHWEKRKVERVICDELK